MTKENQLLRFFCVENRTNQVTELCKLAAARAGVALGFVSAENSNQERYRRFLATYQHFSPNTPDFEITCFRRYFLLLDHLACNSANECVLIDSDVLLFPGIDEHIQSLVRGFDFLGSRIATPERTEYQISPHVSYWTKPALSEFVDFIVSFYSPNGSGFRRTREYFSAHHKELGISDMTLLYQWASACRSAPPINSIRNGKVVDHNVSFHLNVGDTAFLKRFGGKVINFREGFPYFVTTQGEAVRAVAIHCQGKAKLNMRNILDGNTSGIAATSTAILVGKRLKRLVRLGL